MKLNELFPEQFQAKGPTAKHRVAREPDYFTRQLRKGDQYWPGTETDAALAGKVKSAKEVLEECELFADDTDQYIETLRNHMKQITDLPALLAHLDYLAWNTQGVSLLSATSRSSYLESLKPWVGFYQEEVLPALKAKLKEKLAEQREPAYMKEIPPSPGEPWWIGTDSNWKTWFAPLLEKGWVKVRENKLCWKESKSLLGLLAHAAQRKGWMRLTFGTQGRAAFVRKYFDWGSKEPSRNAFEPVHLSERAKIIATPILINYGFTKDSDRDELMR